MNPEDLLGDTDVEFLKLNYTVNGDDITVLVSGFTSVSNALAALRTAGHPITREQIAAFYEEEDNDG